jgi:hypothetical protein
MIRSYLGLSLGLCLMFTGACLPGSSSGGGGEGGGTAGTGGTAQSGGLITKQITFGCANNITTDVSIIPADLEVDSAEITGGAEFAATLSGTVFFPQFFLDAAQGVIPGGLRAAELIDAKAIVQVRSGATATAGAGGAGGAGGAAGEGGAGGDSGIEGVTLVGDVANLIPGLTSFCDFSLGTCSTTTSTQCANDEACPVGETCENVGPNVKICDQANDNADGSNPACLPTVPDGPVCQDPIVIVDLPISEDCAPGGECDNLDKGVCAPGTCVGGANDGQACDTADDCASPGDCDNCPFGTQCGDNQFCVTGDLALALKPEEQTYLADASGDVLFGWADQGLTNATLDPATGLWDIPQSNPSNPLEQGITVLAGPLTVQVACVMAVDSAGPDGVAACVGGASDGQPCQSPADVGNDICFGGDNDGQDCTRASECPGGDCANATCGVDGECEPTDQASLTPDLALVRYTIP